MSNLTYKDLLSKAANPGILECVTDVDLIGLHKFAKSVKSDDSNLLKSRSQSWLPLIEGEIVFRKEAIVKAEEADALAKAEEEEEKEEEEPEGEEKEDKD